MAVSFLTHPESHSRPHLVLLEGGVRRSTHLAARPSSAVYLRRRVLVAVIGLLAVAALVSIVTSVASSAVAGAPTATSTYDVAVGDTLWEIATDLAPTADRRQVVDLLADANGGTVIRPGQRLVVPAEVLALGS